MIVRTVKKSDLENLPGFFVKAYGLQTIFQNTDFLKWYFKSRENNNNYLEKCRIGLSPDNEIVSFYGGLDYLLKVNERIIPLVWGVTAYTLPEWRGKGINGELVKQLIQANEINAVIGMSRKTALFYVKKDYNMFSVDTFKRYVLILKEDTFEIINHINQDIDKAKQYLNVQTVQTSEPNNNIIGLNSENINEYKLDFDIDNITTSVRDEYFLKWRFINNPYVNYRVFAFKNKNKILGYIASREETLLPFTKTAYRIIDIYGKPEYIKLILKYVIYDASERGNIYIDFSMFGILYESLLSESDFNVLENDDICLLPQVSAPIESRPNGEFIGLQSKPHESLIKGLKREDVYFTRADSDRDRLNRISQITV